MSHSIQNRKNIFDTVLAADRLAELDWSMNRVFRLVLLWHHSLRRPFASPASVTVHTHTPVPHALGLRKARAHVSFVRLFVIDWRRCNAARQPQPESVYDPNTIFNAAHCLNGLQARCGRDQDATRTHTDAHTPIKMCMCRVWERVLFRAVRNQLHFYHGSDQSETVQVACAIGGRPAINHHESHPGTSGRLEWTTCGYLSRQTDRDTRCVCHHWHRKHICIRSYRSLKTVTKPRTRLSFFVGRSCVLRKVLEAGAKYCQFFFKCVRLNGACQTKWL